MPGKPPPGQREPDPWDWRPLVLAGIAFALWGLVLAIA